MGPTAWHSAKDWRTRLALSLTHSGRYHFIEAHHIFPKATLKDRHEKSEIDEMANMAFVSGATNRRMGSTPADRTLAQVKDEQGEQALIDHCVPLDLELWQTENYKAFLEHRRAGLAKAIHEFIGEEFDRSVSIDIDGLPAQGGKRSTRVQIVSAMGLPGGEGYQGTRASNC